MKKPMWAVTAQAYSRKTGKPLGKTRTEKIQSDNKMFKGITTIMGVKNRYESFWNNMNPRSKEVVFVKRIKKL